MKLTKVRVEGFAIPVSGQTFFWDDEMRGFGVRITANGMRSYIAQGRVNGKTRRVTVGEHGRWTCDEARKEARELLRKMDLGKDPQEEKQRKKAMGVTLNEVKDSYLRNRDLKEASKRDIERHVTKNFAQWADRPISSISRDACMKYFNEFSNRAPAQANQAFVVLRALYNYARAAYRTPEGDPAMPENPVLVLSETKMWNRETARTGRIPNNRIGAVWSMLQARRNEARTVDDQTAADYVAFLLLTGARASEAAQLTWDRVILNDQDGSWHLPDPKNRNPVTLPLSAAAREILRARPRKKGNDFVFCSWGKDGHITEARGTMEKVSESAEIHLSRHDLRRTFLAAAYACGIEMWKAELLTNHVPQTVTLKHYTETSDLRYLGNEIEMIANWIESQTSIFEGQNVIMLRA